jgi:hypothetical protein
MSHPNLGQCLYYSHSIEKPRDEEVRFSLSALGSRPFFGFLNSKRSEESRIKFEENPRRSVMDRNDRQSTIRRNLCIFR